MSAVTVTIDDDATPADILYIYAGGPETLKWDFYIYDFDVVVTIDDPTVAAQRWIQDIPEHHVEGMDVVVTTIDKMKGAISVTGTKMQEKMRIALRARVEAVAHGPNFILRMPTERPQARRKGGLDRVWETRYTIAYWDA